MKGWLTTQCSWFPALAIFPANRDSYRDFYKFAVFDAPKTQISAPFAGLSTQIPYLLEQGIVLEKHGIPMQEQGNSPAKIEMIIG